MSKEAFNLRHVYQVIHSNLNLLGYRWRGQGVSNGVIFGPAATVDIQIPVMKNMQSL